MKIYRKCKCPSCGSEIQVRKLFFSKIPFMNCEKCGASLVFGKENSLIDSFIRSVIAVSTGFAPWFFLDVIYGLMGYSMHFQNPRSAWIFASSGAASAFIFASFVISYLIIFRFLFCFSFQVVMKLNKK